MKNEGSVGIKKSMTALGAGLLEVALEQEGRKGCSPVICCEPVGLEPLYEVFDSSRILQRPNVQGLDAKKKRRVKYTTFNLFPAEEDLLSIQWMETMLRALCVLRGPMAFELFGAKEEVFVRFAIPKVEVAGFRAAILGHFPALRFQEIAKPFPTGLPVVTELVPVPPYHRSLSLLGREGASPLGLAVKVISELEAGFGCFQVLFCPASPDHDWHFNVEMMAEAEAKATQLAQLGGLSSSFSYDQTLPPLLEQGVAEKVRQDVGFFATVARYCVWSDEGVDDFLQGMRVASGMLRFGQRAWRTLEQDVLLRDLGKKGVKNLIRKRSTHRPGLMLTSRELASLVHIPNARTLLMLQSIQQRLGFEWQSLKAGHGAACLGKNEYSGNEQPVEIPLPLRLRHMYVAGTTGTGKSKLVERLAVDDAYAGLGFCLVDPHGDLCFDVLSRLPDKQMQNLVYVTFSEDGLVPRWNPFKSAVASGKLADDMTRAFLAQTSSTGPRMEHNFRMLAYVVHELGGTLDDFAEMAGQTIRGQSLVEQAIDQVGNPQVQRFLKNELSKYSAREMASVTNKLSRMLLDDQLGAMFRQPDNDLSPLDWIEQGKVVLINLSAGHIGVDHAHFVGSLLISLIYRAALTRGSASRDDRSPFILYVDEFQKLQAATLSELLSEGRKYGIGAVLAHQERGQLGKELDQALGNCVVKVLFRPGERDLVSAVRSLGGAVSQEHLLRLGVGEALVDASGRVSSLKTQLCEYPILRDPGEAARQYAMDHYFRTKGTKLAKKRKRIYDTFG